MQFLLTGKDGADDDALNRRMAARPAHLAGAEKMQADGRLILGGALLDDNGKMIGSIMILNLKDRHEVDEYLKNEPYVAGNVWQNIDVQTLNVGDHYMSEVAIKRKNQTV